MIIDIPRKDLIQLQFLFLKKMGNCYCCLDPSDTEEFARFEDSDEYTSNSSFGTRSRSSNNTTSTDGSSNGGRRRRNRQFQQQGRAPQGTSHQGNIRVIPAPTVSV